MAAGAIVVIASAFLPWVSLLGYSKNGIDYGDGTITLIVGCVGLLALWQGWLGWFGQFACALIVTLLGLYDLQHVGSLAAVGMYLTFIAGIFWGIAAGVARREATAAATTVAKETPVVSGVDAPVMNTKADDLPADRDVLSRPPLR